MLGAIDAIDDTAQAFGSVCRQLLALLLDAFGAENGSLTLLEDRHPRIRVAVDAFGGRVVFTEGEAALDRKFAVGQEVADRVVAGCATLRLDDVTAREFVSTAENAVQVRSLLCAPLSTNRGVVGVLSLGHSTTGYFTEVDERILLPIANRCARVLASHEEIHRHRRMDRSCKLAWEKAGDGIVVLEDGGKVVLANSVAEDVLGAGLQGNGDAVAAWSRRIHADDVPAFEAARAALQGTGAEQTCVYRVVGGDTDAVRYVEDRATRVAALADQPAQVVCVVRDVTERVREAQNRADLEAQLRHAQKMEALGELAGGITHDFNNILTGILANVTLAQITEESAELSELLQDIESAARQASLLTRRLVSMSRRSEFDCSLCDLGDIVNDVVGILRNTVDRRIDIASACEDDLWPVMADRSQIHQVLLNLCVNARDSLMGSLEDRRREHRIVIAARNVEVGQEWCKKTLEARVGEHVCITVRDSGRGIPEAIRGRIFEPFFSTRDSPGGIGLGLAIAYGVVKQHAGWMTLQSTSREGTTFAVFLPRAQDTGRRSGPPSMRPPAALPKATVLLAEDEELMRRAAVRVLNRLGCTVIVARDGQECVDIFEARKGGIDVVILDLNMPRMSGSEALRRIRALDSEVPIVVSSGYATASPEELFGSVRPSAMLPKPYTLEAVAGTLRGVLVRPAK